MSFLKDVVAGGITGIVESVSAAIDRFVQTPDEKAALQLELVKIAAAQQLKLVESADSYEKELTERQKADMSSDSWLAKNIRPMALIYLLSVFTLLAFNDGNLSIGTFHFQVGAAYVSAFRSFAEMMLMFYAGGRSLEKVATSVGTALSRK